jgi:hypothetical protein
MWRHHCITPLRSSNLRRTSAYILHTTAVQQPSTVDSTTFLPPLHHLHFNECSIDFGEGVPGWLYGPSMLSVLHLWRLDMEGQVWSRRYPGASRSRAGVCSLHLHCLCRSPPRYSAKSVVLTICCFLCFSVPGR